jgi:hypothetical protein
MACPLNYLLMSLRFDIFIVLETEIVGYATVAMYSATDGVITQTVITIRTV